MIASMRFRLVAFVTAAGAVTAIAVTALAAQSSAAGTKVYESETTAECVLYPGIADVPGAVRIDTRVEGPETVAKGESFSLEHTTITITMPTIWDDSLPTVPSAVRGRLTAFEVEAQNATPSALNIVSEFPLEHVSRKTPVENGVIQFTVFERLHPWLIGPFTVGHAHSSVAVRYNPIAGFTTLAEGSSRSTEHGIQFEAEAIEEELGIRVGGFNISVSCTEPRASVIAKVPVQGPRGRS
jgi:hypothetical protein